jgi:uncharacterized protein YjeT (DUF2065 family)
MPDSEFFAGVGVGGGSTAAALVLGGLGPLLAPASSRSAEDPYPHHPDAELPLLLWGMIDP